MVRRLMKVEKKFENYTAMQGAALDNGFRLDLDESKPELTWKLTRLGMRKPIAILERWEDALAFMAGYLEGAELSEGTDERPGFFTLTEKCQTLLIMGAKQSGLDASSILAYVGEQMTLEENRQVEGFIKWLKKNKKTFGYGNIQAVWKEYQAQK